MKIFREIFRRVICVMLLTFALNVRSYAQAASTAPSIPPAAAPLPMITQSSLSIRTQKSIERAVQFLLSQQRRDGSWNDMSNSDWSVGQTAIVTLALLSAGESHQTPAIAKAISYVMHGNIAPGYQTYGVALRACLLAQLPEAAKQQELRADIAWLQKAMIARQPNDGLYTYGMPMSTEMADYSNSQYGVLGAWYAAEAGIEIPLSFWRRAEMGWKKGQSADGGWGYTPEADSSYASMTAAGAATLFITNDYLHARDAYDLYHVENNAAVDHAVQWLGKHFTVDYNERGPPPRRQQDLLSAFADPSRRVSGFNLSYMLFGYERVGEASGLTRYGTHRWFDEGADFLVRSQLPNGSWSPDGSISGSAEVEAAYALLFLSRGLSPVAIQKLQFEKRWNNRPRDVADFTFFLRHNTETHFNWQITTLSGSPSELREAPLLYAASDRPLTLSDTDTAALKDYILRGGLFIAVNEGENSTFATSIEKLGVQLFPNYAFHDLPLGDSAYTGNFPTGSARQPLRVLTNGARKLIVLFAKGDVSWKFQSTGGAANVKLSPYNALANMWADSMGAADPLLKGQSTWVEPSSSAVPSNTKISIARLQFSGDWDPEPAGWIRLANLLHNSGDAELQTLPMPIADLAQNIPLAHLTATGAIKLSAAEQAALKKYIDHGGLLFFDAAGGSADAASSMQGQLEAMYPTAANNPLPIDHPIYTGNYPGGKRLDSVSYRLTNAMAATRLPRLRGITLNGKLLAIVSDEDISCGLVGYPSSLITGYTPQSAAEITRAILLWRSSTYVAASGH